MRILGVPPFVVLLLNQNAPGWENARYAAIAIFVLMGLSDALDGYLARRLKAHTRLGSILDPLADKTLITCAVILLASQRASVPQALLPTWVVVSVIAKDLWVVVGFVVVFFVTGQVKIRPTRAGKLCTTGQIVMVAAVLIAPELNRLGGQVGSHLATVLGWAVMALCAAAVASYTRLGLGFVSEHEESVRQAADRESEKDAVQPH